MDKALIRVTCPKHMSQTCPFCGSRNPMLVNGMVRNTKDSNQLFLIPNLGYSYCNCHSIFYTKWENMDKTVYDEGYKDNFNSPEIDELFGNYAKRYFPILKERNSAIKSFAEIGCVNHTLLDRARDEGWETFGVDINPNVDFGVHNKMICDVEKLVLERKFDVIWASHIFEHFKDPFKIADNLHNSLNDGGLLFIAMPDTYFLDMKNPYRWAHWSIKEHYMLWDMDGFIRVMEDRKYHCVYKKHNDGTGFICGGDFHTIFQK